MKRKMFFGGSAAVALLILAAVATAQVPQATPGVTVRVEHEIALADAFPDNAVARNYIFRARQIDLAPGARSEMINHAGRPAITYVTQGSVLEFRTGEAEPIRREVGAATMDRAAISHYWENAGQTPAVLLIVEVAPVARP